MSSLNEVSSDEDYDEILSQFDPLFESSDEEYDGFRFLLPRARRIFLALPYTTGNESVHYSFEDVVFYKNLFTTNFEEWEKTVFRKSNTGAPWGQYSAYLEALCDGLENGTLVISTFDELQTIGTLFHKLNYLYEEPQAVRHFVETGELLELLKLLAVYATEQVRPSVVLDGVEALYCYAMKLKEQSEQDGSENYAIFADMPLDIKVSLSGAFDLAQKEREDRA